MARITETGMKTSTQPLSLFRARLASSILGLSVTLGTPVHAGGALCAGDCHNSGVVNISDLLTLVNIALEALDVAECPDGLASGLPVTVDVILQAADNALNDCGGASAALCGNGHIDPGEECDHGGTCTGGTNAGTACTADSQCEGEGVCVDGSKELTACASDAACTGGKCVKCKTFGGDGCAANCTPESTLPFNLVPGTGIVPGTSGSVIHGAGIPLPLTIAGGQTFLVGKARHGIIPVVVKASAVQISRISVGTFYCSCVRGIAQKTCGGTFVDADGTYSADCTPQFTTGESVCAGRKPCAFLLGAGNSYAGVAGCTAGALTDIDVSVTQDAGGSSSPLGDPQFTYSGGPARAGSALLFCSWAIGSVGGPCTGTSLTYGRDGEFCTDDDPYFARGASGTVRYTTGTASGKVLNADGSDGRHIGPFAVSGQPLDCENALTPLAGTTLANTFTFIGQGLLGDGVVTTVLTGQ
jgi:hypothetical protein